MAPQAAAQVEERDLQKVLSELTKIDSPGTALLDLGILDCGSMNRVNRQRRNLARQIVNMGPSAAPDLETYMRTALLDAKEKHSMDRSRWVFYAYAELLRDRSLPLLREILDGHNDYQNRVVLEESIAIALNVTSFLIVSHEQPKQISCSPVGGSRYTLDSVIKALANGNFASVSEHLTPEAKGEGELNSGPLVVFNDSERSRMEASMRHLSQVGYRFLDAGAWGAPKEALNKAEILETPMRKWSSQVILETQLIRRDGSSCGAVSIRFIPSMSDMWPAPYYRLSLNSFLHLVAALPDCLAASQ